MMVFQFIIFQVIVFSAVIFFMKRILTNDTQQAVGRLDSAYQDLLKKQKELTQKIEEAEKEYAAKKEETVKVTAKMKSEAAEEIRNLKEEQLKLAKTQADEVLGRAHAAVDEFRHKIKGPHLLRGDQSGVHDRRADRAEYAAVYRRVPAGRGRRPFRVPRRQQGAMESHQGGFQIPALGIHSV